MNVRMTTPFVPCVWRWPKNAIHIAGRTMCDTPMIAQATTMMNWMAEAPSSMNGHTLPSPAI
jgi:hypothetical protein